MPARVSKLKPGSAPKPRPWGVIQKSNAWKLAVNLLSTGQEVTIELPKSFLREQGITSPWYVNSFRISLQRYIKRNMNNRFTVYVKNSTIYAVKNGKGGDNE